MKINFILEDYAIFKNIINSSDKKELQLKLDSSTEIKNSETDLGIVTMAKVEIEKEDLQECAALLLEEHNKKIWDGIETEDIQKIIDQITTRAEMAIA